MATFIPGVTDTNLDPVLFTPDYSFLRYNLQKKSSQYEQGLKSISSAYGALKKEMSDPTNVERRDSYLKAAETELQKIASADLSLQQNVNAANSIFDPIATDPAIAYDMYHTSRIKKEMAEMESWASSDDMETRKKFNSQLYSWLKRDLDSLKNGNGDINNYKVQGRKAWAWVDPQDVIMSAAKERGFKVEYDTKGEPYLVTTIGGETFAPNYKAFANEVLLSNPVYQEQKYKLSEAKLESDLENIKFQNPGITDQQQLLSIHYDQSFKKNRDYQKEHIGSLQNTLAAETAEFQAFVKANAVDINKCGEAYQIQQKKLSELVKLRAQINDKTSDFNLKYGANDDDFVKKREEFRTKFLENPKGYYANQIQAEDVTRYANIQSTFGTRTIKADQAYIGVLGVLDKMRNTAANIQNINFDNQMDAAELAEKQREFDAKQISTGLSDRKKKADGTSSASDIRYVGASSEDLKVTTKLDKLKDQVAITASSAIQSLSSGITILESMGSKPEDVSMVRGWLNRKMADPKAQSSNEENQAMKRVYETMFGWLKQDEVGNKELLETMRGQIKDKVKVNNVDFPSLLIKAAKSYPINDNTSSTAIFNLREYEKKQSQLNTMFTALENSTNALIETIKKDKSAMQTFSPILKTEDGKTRLLNESDIDKALSSTDMYGNKIPESLKKEMTQAYFNGQLKVEKPKAVPLVAQVNYDFNQVLVTYKDKTYRFSGNSFGNIPTPDKYQSLVKQLNEKIPVPVFDENNEAKVTAFPMFQLDGDMKEQMRLTLKDNTQTNSNIYEKSSGKINDFTQVDPETQGAIRDAMKDKDNIVDMVFQPASNISEGSQTVKVTFAPKKSEKDTNPIAGKTFYFPLNVTNSAPEITKAFANLDDSSEFMQLSKQNKPYVIDHYESSGAKAIIYPDYPGAKTGTVRLMQTLDPVTGEYGKTWNQVGEAISVNFDQNTLSEVKEEIFKKFIDPFVQRRMQYNKQALNKQNSNGGVDLAQQLLKSVTW